MAQGSPSSALPQSPKQFADLLDRCSGLRQCCETGLAFLLENLQRQGGVLFIQDSAPQQSILMAHQGLTKDWTTHLSNRESTLISTVQKLLTAPSTDSDIGTSNAFFGLPDLAAFGRITHHNQNLGFILIQGAQCSSSQLELLEELLPVIGREIWTFLRLDHQNRRLEENARLQTELAELAVRADSDAFQRHLITSACSLLESQVALLVLADEENPGWNVYKSLDSQSNWIFQFLPSDNRGPISECLLTGNITTYEGDPAGFVFDPACTDQRLLQARSILCAPLRTQERIFGALVVLDKLAGSYNGSDQAMLASFASLGAAGFQTARQVQQFRLKLAESDASQWEQVDEHNALRALMDHLPNGLYLIDPDYRLRLVNKSRAERVGLESRSLPGQICYQALFNRTEPCPECLVQESLSNGQITQRGERRRLDEAIVDWEIHTYPIRNDQGVIHQALLLEVDVTEKRHLESILIQSEKLAAIGQLAAGIAHEINNPLTAIIANAQILHRELPPSSDLQESVDLIARAGARAAQVVRNLLDFARKEEYRLGLTDINETLERAVELVQHELLARGVALEMELDSNLPLILASSDLLQSVWLNLLLNAIDSLDKTPEKICVSSRYSSREVQISVADNGRGIPADSLSRIFEPFFTTKAPGRGTGLGLSVSNRIIRQHGGYFLVDSQVGQGSTFKVILPAS